MSEFEKQPDASAPEQNATPAEPIAVPVPPKGGINGRLIAELAVLAVAVIALCVVGEVKKPEWWMLLRASLGSTGMQYTLGEYYANPDNPKQNLKKAEKWLKKAAERGNSQAAFKLTEIVRSDKDKMHWLTRSAEMGVAEAQYLLGQDLARNGKLEEAVKWYEKAAAQNLPRAQHVLAGCYRRGEGVKADPAKAKEWYQKAVAQGYGPSEVMLEEMAAEKK